MTALTASAAIPVGDITGLGTAATLTVGTAASNIIQLDLSAKLPAVDGSLLSNVNLRSDTNANTRVGTSALGPLPSQTSGAGNTGIGYQADYQVTSGDYNTAIGFQAGYGITSGISNTSVGSYAGSGVTTGTYNIAVGDSALGRKADKKSGASNIAIGLQAEFQLTTGNRNIGIGDETWWKLTDGNNNTAVGYRAGYNLVSGSNNLAFGYEAGYNLSGTGSNNIVLGNTGVSTDDGTIRIGTVGTQTSAYIAGIKDVTLTGTPKTVVIDSTTGQLGSIASSGGSGTVTSVGLSLPSLFTVTNSPVSTTGTLTGTLASQTMNTVFAAPSGAAGAPTFRALLAADIPALNQNTTGTAANVTGTVAVANGGTGSATQNFVDLTTTQTIAGSKTFSGGLNVSTGSTYKLGGADLLHSKGSLTNLFLGVLTGAVATTGGATTAIGYGAGGAVTDAWDNTFVGYSSGAAATGGGNSFFGKDSGSKTVAGQLNVFAGSKSGSENTSGSHNAFFGFQAGSGNTTGTTNIAIGSGTGSALGAGSYNIYLGGSVAAEESATIRIGYALEQSKTFIAGISGVAVTGVAVQVNASGQLGVVASSRRFKENIQDMAQASSRIFDLRPVTFNYKAEYGGGGTQYGLIAEEVDQVIPEMTVRDKDGQIETVAYQLLPPMLLNELQKQQRTIEAQRAEIDALKAQVAAILARLPH